ncbi:Phosphotransferase enzyme family domain containing protein [Rhypophila decipiens]
MGAIHSRLSPLRGFHIVSQPSRPAKPDSTIQKLENQKLDERKLDNTSVWDRYLPEDRVRWSSGWDSNPIWSTEPDLDAIKAVIASELFKDGDHRKDPNLTVRFLADGAHHRVYEATHPSWTNPYLLRLAVAVDPCLKTESEMATLAFLSQKTSIPVPKPIAWNSGVDSRIGYEWQLIEKLPGVQLRSVWRTMSPEQQAAVVREMATLLAQMWTKENRFDRIGGLYLTQDQHSSPAPNIRPRHVRLGDMQNSKFVVGPSVAGSFNFGRYHYLPVSRGPFNTCREWVKALIDVERELLDTAKLLLESRDEGPAEYRNDPEAWDNLVETGIEVNKNFLDKYQLWAANPKAYMDFLPNVFPESTPVSSETNQHPPTQRDSMPTSDTVTASSDQRFVLLHPDLRDANILVDPESFAITGIIDWERTVTTPTWHGMYYPLLINKDEPYHEDEPDIPTTYDKESPDYNACLVDMRDQWDARILRGEFDKQMEKLGCQLPWIPSSRMDKFKMSFVSGINDIKNEYIWASNALEGLKEEWEEMEQRRMEVEELVREEEEAKEALRMKQEQELRELIEALRQKHEQESREMVTLYEEKRRMLKEKHEMEEQSDDEDEEGDEY